MRNIGLQPAAQKSPSVKLSNVVLFTFNKFIACDDIIVFKIALSRAAVIINIQIEVVNLKPAKYIRREM